MRICRDVGSTTDFSFFFSCVFACPVVQRPGLPVNDKSLLRNGAGIWWRNSLPALPQREACRKESKGYIKQECAGLTRLCQLTATQTHVILQNILTQTQFHNVKQSYQNGLVARWKAYRKRLSGKQVSPILKSGWCSELLNVMFSPHIHARRKWRKKACIHFGELIRISNFIYHYFLKYIICLNDWARAIKAALSPIRMTTRTPSGKLYINNINLYY